MYCLISFLYATNLDYFLKSDNGLPVFPFPLVWRVTEHAFVWLLLCATDGIFFLNVFYLPSSVRSFHWRDLPPDGSGLHIHMFICIVIIKTYLQQSSVTQKSEYHIVLNECSCSNKRTPSSFWQPTLKIGKIYSPKQVKTGEKWAKIAEKKKVIQDSGLPVPTWLSVSTQGAFIQHYTVFVDSEERSSVASLLS